MCFEGALASDPCIGQLGHTQEKAVAVPYVQANHNLLNLNASFLAQREVPHVPTSRQSAFRILQLHQRSRLRRLRHD